MAKDLYFDHRGKLTGMTARGGTLIVSTWHPEDVPMPIQRFDLDAGKVTTDTLPTGALALAFDAESIYVAGADKRLYVGPIAGGALSAQGEPFEDGIAALAPVDGGVAVLSGKALIITDGTRFDLPAAGTCLAVDPSGRWIVAGTNRGHVAVFEREERDSFMAAESARLHEGEVTALQFMPDELRFLSAGVDKKLLLTHARGALEAEDRAGRQGHDDAIQAMLHLGDRTYTGGKDGQIKSWGRGKGNRRPQSYRHGGKAIALAEVTYKERQHLAVAAADGRIRVFQLDGNGKPVLKVVTVHNAYAKARNAFEQREPERRQAALRTLAAYNDRKALKLVAERAAEDPDHALRVEACTLLGQSGNPQAVAHLEGLLRARTGEVRLAALDGLRTLRGAEALEPLDQALDSNHADLGTTAVEALTPLAKQNEDAHARLVRALDHRTREVRFAALAALESLADAPDPTPSLTALGSRYADLRGHALLRFFQRDLLADDQVQGALRRHGEDGDANVRLMAFQIAILARPTLANALRGRDKTLHRQLHALETHGSEKEVKLPRTKRVKAEAVTASDRRPLIEAMASRALDTCVRGAVALASLQDPRAFGTLLQLSRDPDSDTRVAACRALADQGDVRGVARLRQMLRDDDAAVRDAAYSAVVSLISDPVAAAEAGLTAQHEDIRRRGLKELVKLLKKAPKKKAHLALLGRAVNDSAWPVRSEAFKTAVNLPAGGSAEAALRFALQSLHADVRREVLTEVMGEIAQDWAWPLLLDLFEDPDQQVRSEAFEFARKKGRGKSPEPLAHALKSGRVDIRLASAKALATKRIAAARPHLITALDDAAAEVRMCALDALAGDVEALVQAMGSAHADVRVKAAAVRAAAGDVSAAAPLLAQLEEPKPDVSERASRWQTRMVLALDGLADLGHAPAAEPAKALLAGDDLTLQRAATRTLAWVSAADDRDALREALRHGDAEIKQTAALGLAWLGDPAGMSILTPPPAPRHTRRGRRRATQSGGPPADKALIAALVLGDRDQVLAALDHATGTVRLLALRLILLLEWREGDARPDWCLAALSSANPRVRLTAARALEQFGDADAFEAVVIEQLNVADRSTPWTIDAAIWRRLADAITHGTGRFRVRAAQLLTHLRGDQAAFEARWAAFASRFDAVLSGLDGSMPEAADSGLEAVVFGAYVGLSRIGGGSTEAAIRVTALARIAALAGDPVDWEAVGPVMLQAIRDSYGNVRLAAFDHLATLGYPRAALAAEALGTGQRDVGVRGLEILAADAGAEGETVLRRVLTTYTDGLEHEAASLLAERVGVVAAMQAGFEARSADRRRQSVITLAGRDDARDALVAAMDVRFKDVRRDAALALARRQDSAAFDTLVGFLRDPDRGLVSQAIEGLIDIQDARAPDALLDRLADNLDKSAPISELLRAVGRLHQVASFERLMTLFEADQQPVAVFDAMLAISGYDQYIGDDDDAHNWSVDQLPRHDDLLIRLLNAVHAKGDARLARQLMAGARWAKDPAVHAALAPYCSFHDDRTRRAAVEGIAWRARERDGSPEPLVAAVAHADPQTGFLAAEGLALVGRSEGVSVLLSAIDLGDDLDARGRAVKALGRLADPRGIDTLIGLASDDEHALQEAAAEAIGHLAGTEQAEQVFTLLARLVERDDWEVAMNALTGLRYFDTPSAWALVRGRAEDGDWSTRERVAELLAHDDSDASRAVLVERIKNDDDWDVVQAAAKSLRRLYGPDSLEPDYALLQSEIEPDDEVITRVAEQGEADRIFALLPDLRGYHVDTIVEPLVSALLARDPLPLAAAVGALDASHARVGTVAARIVGRAGAAASAHAEAVEAATRSTLDAWRTEAAQRRSGTVHTEALTALTERLGQLIWACARLSTADAVILDAVGLDGVGAAGRPVRAAAVAAIADGRGGDAAVETLRAVATGPDAPLRTLAAAALADRAPAVAEALLPEAMSDRGSLDRLVAGVGADAARPALHEAAAQAHAQGVALPHLIAQGDVDGLAAVAQDGGQTVGVRSGAVEALARIASASAQAALVAVGTGAEDEELRKSAWRALRRAKRIQRQEARS